MVTPRNRLKGSGTGLLGVGMAFLVLAFNGQPAMLGVGMAFLAVGLGLLDRARRGGGQ
ncbi:hypothetical protein [Thermomonas sp.]|jgi:hypothetical protein|uniref:hypothetical protein n=1 Tax=Thermomonas sp. TaxID=1971895 RepID=UPI00257A713E|nr:hypothetical protein [Thermomonas sp.]